MGKKIRNLIIAYLITFAIYNIGGFASADILLGVIFVAVYAIIDRITAQAGAPVSPADPSVAAGALTEAGGRDASASDRALRIWSHAIAAVWTVLYAVYASDRLGGGMENALFVAVYTVCTLVGIYVLIYFTVHYVLMSLTQPHTGTAVSPARTFSLRTFAIYAGIIFICLLPLFLMNFPGTMTVDSFDQLNQARGIYPYSDLHPWAHTLIIQLFWHLGYAITHSVTGGIATYTIAQMIIMSVSVAYAIEVLGEEGASRTVRIAVLLGYILYPYNPAYAVTMWKDVIFAAGVLVFTVTLYRIVRRSSTAVRDYIIFGISALAMSMLRHNGFYAFIITLAVLCPIRIVSAVKMRRLFAESGENRASGGYAARHPHIYIIPAIGAAVIVITCIFNGPIHRAYDVEPVEYAHNLAIPLQQVARVVSRGGDISAEDMEMLERINTPEYLRTHYHPGGADPSMQWVIYGDMAYLEAHKADYLGLWIRLGLHNPRAYVEAYIDQTRGYYTTMPPEQTEYYGILPNEDGLENLPLILRTRRIKINEILGKLHTILPVYAIFYSPGACMQLMLLGVAVIVLRGKNKTAGSVSSRGVTIIAYLPVFTLILTVLIATPLCADLRYAYPLMLCMPALCAITLKR